MLIKLGEILFPHVVNSFNFFVFLLYAGTLITAVLDKVCNSAVVLQKWG